MNKPVAEPAEIPSLQTELKVTGMTCSGCVAQVTEALQSITGVDHAQVQLEQQHATVNWKPNFPPDESKLLGAVRKAGYRAEVAGVQGPVRRPGAWSPLAGWKFNVVAGSILTIPLFVAEWGLGVGMEPWYHWLAFLLMLPVQTICGARFYLGAWNQLKVGSSNMDTLVVLGSTTAFLYSAWGLFSGWEGHLFFMESGAIITLISLGHYIESRVSARASASLRALLNLAPKTARMLGPNQAETIVPVSQLRPGDLIILKPGDNVPIDGEVAEGASSINESMLTGESAPADKGKGSKIYAGTNNLHGWLLVRVTATGQQTALAHIINVVQRAQASRADIQKLGDRVSSIFVPIVVLVALGTGIWWGFFPESALSFSGIFEPYLWPVRYPAGPFAAAIHHAAAVLIIACPCAMGLATPVAIMAGTNVAAERGILIRDGLALEKTGRLSAIIFDKTGTLTEGKLAVTAVEDFRPSAERTIGLHKLAASLAKPSNHPVSQAVARLSRAVFPVAEWREIRGAGVESKLALSDAPGQVSHFRLGSFTLLKESGVDLTAGEAFSRKWAAKGATLIGLAEENRLLGVFALHDAIKKDAALIVRQLIDAGQSVFMVTGDNARTANSIAAQVGIAPDHVFAEVRPEGKAKIVEKLQRSGHRVAFIGDGINDAPALEQAELGIAVSQASDVAREAADIILLKSDIHAVPEALNLSRATLRTIKQNLFWAFFYNAAAVPVAALGFLSPIISALAMGLSDLIVVFNALRLRRWKGQ
jgi:P-type Cu+ transporter